MLMTNKYWPTFFPFFWFISQAKRLVNRDDIRANVKKHLSNHCLVVSKALIKWAYPSFFDLIGEFIILVICNNLSNPFLNLIISLLHLRKLCFYLWNSILSMKFLHFGGKSIIFSSLKGNLKMSYLFFQPCQHLLCLEDDSLKFFIPLLESFGFLLGKLPSFLSIEDP